MTQTATAPEARTQAENLDQLAAVAINVGLGLKPGQELVMTASSTPCRWRAASPSRLIAPALRSSPRSSPTTNPRCCAIVTRPTRASTTPPSGSTTAWPQPSKAAPRAWPSPAPIPRLLSNEDPDKVGRANRAVSQAYRRALELITRHEINWTIVAGATPAWAAAMFPNDTPDEALRQAVGCHLRHHAHQHRRSRKRMEGARRRICTSAPPS